MVTPGYPHGPSAHAFALHTNGSILNTTGPAASRTFAAGTVQLKRDPLGGSGREPNGPLPKHPVGLYSTTQRSGLLPMIEASSNFQNASRLLIRPR